MDDGDLPVKRVSTRERVVHLLVTAPSVVSLMATLVLLLGLVFGRFSGGLVGGPLGAALVAIWASRPGGVVDAEDDRPRRVTDRQGLAVLCGAAGADAVVGVVVLATGRLPLWVTWLAGGLFVVHVVLALRGVVRVRRRRQAPPPGYDDPKAPERADLRWRSLPEPLRTTGFVVAVLTGVMLVVSATSLLSGRQPGDGLFVVVFGSSFAAVAAVLAVVAFDAGGAAREMGRRAQLRRRASRFPIADDALPRWVLVFRLGAAGACALFVGAAVGAVALTWG